MEVNLKNLINTIKLSGNGEGANLGAQSKQISPSTNNNFLNLTKLKYKYSFIETL
ncbi:MAG: hypothetical protein H7296_09330 [Bacteroidia bacterium]|nr:hypothetical protein [Bacteroidia bacterium]